MIPALLASIAPEAAASTGESSNQLVQIAGAFGVKPHLLLAQIVNFTLVAWILYSLVLKPILKQLDSRAQLIDEGLKRAEESTATLAKAQAERDALILEARRSAQQIVETTQKEIATYEAKQRNEAQREASELLEKARRQSVLEQEQIVQASRQQIADIVVKVAESSLGESLTPEQRSRVAERTTASLRK